MFHLFAEVDVDSITNLLRATGITGGGVLILIAIGFVKGWIVPGYLYREQVNRADRCEERMFESLRIAERATDVVDESVKKVEAAVAAATRKG